MRFAQSKEKLQHQQRQEAAQQRKEEKKKAEKEKMLLETDPEKTRKWEVCGHHANDSGIFGVPLIGKGTQETGQENEQSAHETDESQNAVVFS